MSQTQLTPELRRALLERQRDEITEYYIYLNLAQRVSDPVNREVLEEIAAMEKRHYDIWRALTGEDVPPNRWKVILYSWLGRLLGLAFTLRLMERGEEQAQQAYDYLAQFFPQARDIEREEAEHEERLLGLLQEEKMEYVSSVVLGLNDALVELTGALAGFTLALRSASLIALSGLITGLAAAMSMAASEYLSTKAEKGPKHPLKAALYTGVAYLFTVIALILPYLFLDNYYLSLALALVVAITIIALFTFYISVARGSSFWRDFLEMTLISLGVAALSFGLGYLLRRWLGVEVDV
ncbi:MAG: rubrerythrin family protein [Chloroflexi bacterium]|nr:rubrerythrin family protein [Chloroflexota bacterium]